MAEDYLICPLCAFTFEKQDTVCAHGCPLGAMCDLVRCPNCDYEFPETPQRLSWLGRLLGKRPPRPSDLPGVKSLKELKVGERAKVLCLGAGGPSRHNALAVFGLAPGAEITLLQQRPACVIRVDETELALDSDIAREILLQPVGARHAV